MGLGKCEICGVEYFASGSDKPHGCTGEKDTCPIAPKRKKTGKVVDSIGDKSTGDDNTFSKDNIEGKK